MLSRTLKKGFYIDATDFILIVFILFALTMHTEKFPR